MERERVLGNLTSGDIFHAEGPEFPSLICIVVSVSENQIEARTVTNQAVFHFDRRTGVSMRRTSTCTIDSVIPLPIDIHNALLGLDRKFRLEHRPDRHKLTDEEKEALIFVADFYPKNRLPSE